MVTSAAPVPAPTLISGVNEAYPGTAILGDARALSTFLLQRRELKRDDKSTTGWILFVDEALKKGKTVELDIDLGNGTSKIQFTLPGV